MTHEPQHPNIHRSDPPALSPRTTRELLESLGLRPNRKLGQNFLIDGNIVKKSLALAAVSPGESVVEIGPGLGTLTRALLHAGCRVHAVERDPHLHQFLEERLRPEFPDRLFLLKGDAVEHPLAGLSGDASTPFKIVANLPYAISTPWLDAVLSSGRLPEKMVLMLKQETAARFTAVKGHKDMGAITLFLQAAYETERGHRVPRRCFHPAPDVDSCLLNLKRRTDPRTFLPETKTLIRRCFGQRRKQIGPLIRKFAPGHDLTPWLERLSAEGLSPKTRPEAIPVPLWLELDRLLQSPPD